MKRFGFRPRHAAAAAVLPAVAAVAGIVHASGSRALSVAEIEAAQAAWGEGIVRIGSAMLSDGDPASVAREHIASLYAYEHGPVLFKPTKAAQDQFRGSFDEALSYFVGGSIAEDSGFALQPWTKVRFENEAVRVHGDTASAMGNYYFTTTDGTEVKVEYTFGYVADDAGNPRIYLHHSSLPYNG